MRGVAHIVRVEGVPGGVRTQFSNVAVSGVLHVEREASTRSHCRRVKLQLCRCSFYRDQRAALNITGSPTPRQAQPTDNADNLEEQSDN
jgi:hypothetical protein